jgi:hypothetical protein
VRDELLVEHRGLAVEDQRTGRRLRDGGWIAGIVEKDVARDTGVTYIVRQAAERGPGAHSQRRSLMKRRLILILGFVITGAFLGAPPDVRAGTLTYDVITAPISGGFFDGQTIQAFFTYDTTGDPFSQISPAGVVAPANAAFTSHDAEINVQSGPESTLEVEAYLDTSSISGFSPPGTTMLMHFGFGGPIVLTQALTLPFSVGTLSFIDGTTGFGVGVVTSIVQRASPIPEPSTILLLVFGSLVAFGVTWWRQHRERPTPGAA